MDLLMSCGRRDEHARMLRPVCCRPQLSTACSVVTSRRLAVIMAHSPLGTAERQMWRLHNPCGLMCGDGCLLRLAHVPVQAARDVLRRRAAGIERRKQQRYRIALRRAQPALARRLGATEHAVAHLYSLP